jgi:2-C-methyl-D-erythritol 4-phosphate cytidylyltransferase
VSEGERAVRHGVLSLRVLIIWYFAKIAMVSVVVPAAGRSSRIGGAVSKQFMSIGELPVLVHTLSVFQTIEQITEILVVCRDRELTECRSMLRQYQLDKIKDVIAGGSTRQESVYNGVRQVADESEITVVHDGARPFVTQDIVCRCIEAARLHGAACAAVRVKDTVKVGSVDGFVTETLERSLLWSVQTPQAFDSELLRHAYDQAGRVGFLGTDDCMLVERLGHKVKLIEGAYDNIKITTPDDFITGESILRSRLADAKHN